MQSVMEQMKNLTSLLVQCRQSVVSWRSKMASVGYRESRVEYERACAECAQVIANCKELMIVSDNMILPSLELFLLEQTKMMETLNGVRKMMYHE